MGEDTEIFQDAEQSPSSLLEVAHVLFKTTMVGMHGSSSLFQQRSQTMEVLILDYILLLNNRNGSHQLTSKK